MHIATWDIGDLDNPFNIAERCSDLAALEFTKYKLDIVALSATQNVTRDFPFELEGGYTFFWNGKAGERRHTVGFAVKDTIASKLIEPPVAISENILTLRIPLKKKCSAVLVSVYGPAPDDGYQTKKDFYNILDTFLSTVPVRDRLFLMGNFNATVGCNVHQWEGVLGHHGYGRADSTGSFLLKTCAKHDLLITNTVYKQKDKYKATWVHPLSGEWLLVDYMIIRRRDRDDITHTRAMSGIEFVRTYHRLVRSNVTLPIAIYTGNPAVVMKNGVRVRKQHQKQAQNQASAKSSGKGKKNKGKGKKQGKPGQLESSAEAEGSGEQEEKARSTSGSPLPDEHGKQETPSSSEPSQDEDNKTTAGDSLKS